MYDINGYKLLQYPGELEELAAIFKAENVRSYLEIGCKFGGSLWFIGNSLPWGSRIVGVDLMAWNEQTAKLTAAVRALPTEHKVTLIKGDSTNQNIVRDVAKHAPFDACFIDGNHSLAGVTADWNNYGPMCRIVCFHDINYHRSPAETEAIRKSANPSAYAIDVPKFWNDVKVKYRHKEIKLDKRDNGIGVLWR